MKADFVIFGLRINLGCLLSGIIFWLLVNTVWSVVALILAAQ